MLQDAFVTHVGVKARTWTNGAELAGQIRTDLDAAVAAGVFDPGVTFALAVANPAAAIPEAIVVTIHGLPEGAASMTVPEWIEADLTSPADSRIRDLAYQIAIIVQAYNTIDLALYGTERDEMFPLVIEIAQEGTT